MERCGTYMLRGGRDRASVEPSRRVTAWGRGRSDLLARRMIGAGGENGFGGG